ncbi:MAG: enhanced serine sensitivity protein SseB C-terminal domain-containing protein, partial [Desulfurivibrionaceae bacterium]|jgi:hypothetical protein
MFKKIISTLGAMLLTTHAHPAPNDTNHVIALTLLKETKVRVGVPAELPGQLVNSLSSTFIDRTEIKSAKISLAQFDPTGASPFFSYVVGVNTTGDSESIIDFVSDKIRTMHKLPIPIVVVDINQNPELFTAECPQFYTRKQ